MCANKVFGDSNSVLFINPYLISGCPIKRIEL